MRKFKLTANVAKRLMNLDFSGKTADNASVQEPLAAESIPDEKAEKQNPQERIPAGSLRMAWRTDIGKIRKTNQDAVILGDCIAGIADGMGGHRGGETASAGLRDGILREIVGMEPTEERLRTAVQKVNGELWDQQEHDATLSGMGTTLTLLWAAPDRMIIAQVGDSRAYLYRDGTLRQITSDHSMVADMVRKGVLTEEQAACHPMRNYITRAVGTDDTLDVDIVDMPRHAGDRWLICSDGLHGAVPRAELARLVAMENLEESANALLEEALKNDGRDNISLILVLDESDDSQSREPVHALRKEGRD